MDRKRIVNIGIAGVGVLMDIRAAIARAVSEDTGREIKAADLPRKKVATNSFGIPVHVYERAERRVFGHLAEHAELFPQVKEHLDALCAEGYLVTVVSGNSQITRGGLLNFIERHSLVVAEVYAQQREKALIYRDCDAVIEDRLKYLTRHAGNGIRTVLMLPPPGAGGANVVREPVSTPAGVLLARGWPQAYAHLHGAA